MATVNDILFRKGDELLLDGIAWKRDAGWTNERIARFYNLGASFDVQHWQETGHNEFENYRSLVLGLYISRCCVFGMTRYTNRKEG